MSHFAVKLSLLSLMSIFIFSCRQDSITSKDKVLDIRMAKQPEKLNPILFPNATSREVNQYIFLPLADFDPVTYELTPVLIKSIPVAEKVTEGKYKDQTRFTFEILPDAMWDGGKPVTGEDYVFTLKTGLHTSASAGAYRSLISHFSAVEIDPTNPKKVSVYYPENYILALQSVIVIELLPKHIYDPNGALDKVKFEDLLDEKNAESIIAKDSALIKFAADVNSPKFTKEQVIGCGPYKLETWNTDQNIILSKKENYWAKNKEGFAYKQGPDKIVFHIIPDETAALTRLQNKEIDVLTGLNNNNFSQLKKDSSSQYSFHNPQLIKYYCILLNHNDEILKSKNVRKALASVVDVDQFINTFEGGAASRTIGHVNPIKNFYNKSIEPYKSDGEAANKYLVEDGWSDSNKNGIVDKKLNGKTKELTIDLLYSGELGQNICLLIKEAAAKVGIDIVLVKKEMPLIRKENIETGKYAAVMQVSSSDMGLDDLYLRFHSDNAELGEGNYGFYKNSKVDSLITAINESENAVERTKMYMQVQEYIHDDLPYIFLYSPQERIVISKNWNASTNAKRPGYQANTFTAN